MKPQEELVWACFRNFAADPAAAVSALATSDRPHDRRTALASLIATVTADTLESLERTVCRYPKGSQRREALIGYLVRHSDYLAEQRRFWSALSEYSLGLAVPPPLYEKRLLALLGEILEDFDASSEPVFVELTDSFGIPKASLRSLVGRPQ